MKHRCDVQGFLWVLLRFGHILLILLRFHFSETKYLIFPTFTTSLIFTFDLFLSIPSHPRWEKRRNSSLYACTPAHEAFQSRRRLKRQNYSLVQFCWRKEDPHLGCTDFFFSRYSWYAQESEFPNTCLSRSGDSCIIFSETRPWGVTCTWGQSVILAGNEISITVHSRGHLFKDQGKKIIISLGMWYILW